MSDMQLIILEPQILEMFMTVDKTQPWRFLLRPQRFFSLDFDNDNRRQSLHHFFLFGYLYKTSFVILMT
jgi:hypothetical protein